MHKNISMHLYVDAWVTLLQLRQKTKLILASSSRDGTLMVNNPSRRHGCRNREVKTPGWNYKRENSWNCDAFKCSQPAHDGMVARVHPPARPHLLISPNSMISWGPSIQKPKTMGTVLIQITTMDMYANWLPWSSHCIITHMILLNISYHKLYIHNHPLVPARYLSQDILWVQILIFLSLCVKWCSICT